MHVMALHNRFVWTDLIACSACGGFEEPDRRRFPYPLAVASSSPTVRPSIRARLHTPSGFEELD